MLTFIAAALAFQQSVTLPPLPPPTPMRGASGAPGPRYWQQRADYAIRATLDTGAKALRGSQRIYYENRSPDPLSVLWLHGFGEGITVTRFTAGGRAVTPTAVGTMRRVDLPTPIRPRARITLEIDWRLSLTSDSDEHIVELGAHCYHLALWYPRMAVYDDVHGWDTLSTRGAGESYLGFGDFDVRLTIPAGFVVAATGMVSIANADDVRTPRQRGRLARALESAEAVAIVTLAEAVANATRRVPGTRTWRFIASNVRDFAWAAGPALRWDASVWDGILVQTFYHPEATSWERANGMQRFALRHLSRTLGRYPWPQFSAVQGRTTAGSEHAMIVFGQETEKREDLFRLLAEQVGHQWFPMQVSSDEGRHPWMDERPAAFAAEGAAAAYFRTRPAREREQLERALAEYVQRWRGKHPQPADFFRTIADVTGRDVAALWGEWGAADQ